MRFYSPKYQASGSPLCRGKLCILSNSRIVVGVGKLEYACYLRCLQGTEVNPVSLCFRNSRNKLNEQTKDKHVEIENREVILSGRIKGQVEIGKEVQLYGDGWKLSFWWSACCVYRSKNIMYA